MKKQSLQGRLALGVVLGALALAPAVQAAGTTTTTGAGMMAPAMSAQPMMMVTGKVNNYWTDASGFVTAVDIQTANGPAVVHFAPGMANRLMQAYPIGSNASLWVQGTMQEGTMSWDLVGVGDKMPSGGFWPAMSANGLSWVTGWPMIDTNAGRVTVDGKLRRVVVNNNGEVVGLIVETDAIYRGTPKTVLGFGKPGDGATGEVLWEKAPGASDEKVSGSTKRDTTKAPDTKMMGGMMGNPMWSLIRVGDEFHPAPGHSGNMRGVTPLLAGDDIRATGFMESSRYGTVSNWGTRLAASAIVVNGRGVGILGFPQMKVNEPTLFNFDINIPFLTGKTPDALQVVPGGYEVYSGSSGGMMPGGPMLK